MENLKKEALAKIVQAADVKALEEARVAILGKNGSLTAEMKSLGALSLEEKKEKGALLNVIKAEIEKALADRMDELERVEMNRRLAAEKVDVTLPVRPSKRGKIHPDSQIHEEVAAIFGQMGFAVAEGPDIETQYYNFTALNTPENHPARQMQDTFYLAGKEGEDQLVLRTQTSAVQIRTMLKQKPPIKIIAPGRTYRSDYDATHTPMFHQVEGLVIDKNITLANLKGCLMDFLKAFFEIDDVKIRLRPSYFPFTEPSFEVDIGCKRGKGELKIGAGDDWLEILGCGMVHPNVLHNCGIDPEEYQGFAFGIGIDRIAMLKYGIPDLRAFFDSDLRWLEHYGFNPLKRPSLTGGLS